MMEVDVGESLFFLVLLGSVFTMFEFVFLIVMARVTRKRRVHLFCLFIYLFIYSFHLLILFLTSMMMYNFFLAIDLKKTPTSSVNTRINQKQYTQTCLN